MQKDNIPISGQANGILSLATPRTVVYSRSHLRVLQRRLPAIPCFSPKKIKVILRTRDGHKNRASQTMVTKACFEQQLCILQLQRILLSARRTNYGKAPSILLANGMSINLESEGFTSSRINQP